MTPPRDAPRGRVPAVHVHTAPDPGSVNAYWVDLPGGVLVVDTQRALSEAARMADRIAAAGRPVLAVLLTHPHPDHWAGAGVFKARWPAAPLVCSAATATALGRDPDGLVAMMRGWLRDDFPPAPPVPDRVFDGAAVLELAGAEVRARDVGPAESESSGTYYLPAYDWLFAGDLFMVDRGPFLLEGRSGPWLAALTALDATVPETATVYPGHGPWGDRRALTITQAAAIELFRHLVRASAGAAPGGRWTDEAGRRVAAALARLHPEWLASLPAPGLVERFAAAAAREFGLAP